MRGVLIVYSVFIVAGVIILLFEWLEKHMDSDPNPYKEDCRKTKETWEMIERWKEEDELRGLIAQMKQLEKEDKR